MDVADELERLSRLHKEGVLSDEEFAQAKRKVLDSPPAHTLGDAANRFVNLQVIVFFFFAFICLVCIFGVVLPALNPSPQLTVNAD